jgi:hypothetical protein
VVAYRLANEAQVLDAGGYDLDAIRERPQVGLDALGEVVQDADVPGAFHEGPRQL